MLHHKGKGMLYLSRNGFSLQQQHDAQLASSSQMEIVGLGLLVVLSKWVDSFCFAL